MNQKTNKKLTLFNYLLNMLIRRHLIRNRNPTESPTPTLLDFQIVPKTENFHIQNIFNNGQLTKVPNISGRINDFWITYTNQKTISQFYSDISILDINGNEVKRQTSFVNSPTIYNNVKQL